MQWTAFSFVNNFARSSRHFSSSALLVALAGCEVQPPNDTYPDAGGVFSCFCDGCVDCDNDDANGCETNIKTDENNCGSCGTVCTNSMVCTNGTCDLDNTECSSNAQCKSGFCVDGICCNEACNGSAVCKGEVGQSCVSNADCLTGYCDGGICGPSITQVGPLVWEWHIEEEITSLPTYLFPDLFVSDMVATDDGRVRVVGTYFDPIFGMPSGGYDEMIGMQYAYYHNDTGPHAFVFDLDANAQTGTFQQYFAVSNWLDKVAGEYTSKGRYAKGPKLRIIGGDKALYFEGWEFGPLPKGSSTDVCKYGHLIKSAAPSWSLGNMEVCALQASSFAGDQAGNTFVRHSGGVNKYDPAGQLVQTLADPFNGSAGELAIGPQGEFHLASRDKLAVHFSKADAVCSRTNDLDFFGTPIWRCFRQWDRI